MQNEQNITWGSVPAGCLYSLRCFLKTTVERWVCSHKWGYILYAEHPTIAGPGIKIRYSIRPDKNWEVCPRCKKTRYVGP